MNADLAPLLSVGIAVVLFAATALVLLVRRDLAPSGGLSGTLGGGGQWFLGAALGIGVIAFTIKLVIILVLSTFPDQTIAPLIADPATWEAHAGTTLWPEGSGTGPGHTEWKPLPLVVPSPPDNPTTPAKVELGERLFHDPALSIDRTVSCASCHDVMGRAGTDRRATAVGVTRVPGRRNSPTVWNAAFQQRLFWDGRAASLEEQAMGPPLNPDEMGMPSYAAIEERVAADPSYHAAFAEAFGAEQAITMQRIVQAIAAYERTLVAADTPYDRFLRGDDGALTGTQKRGMWLFQSIGCVTCHSGPNFSGAAMLGPQNPYAALMAGRSPYARPYGLAEEKGRASSTATDGVWRIPSLRNVALTAPYFHNGSVTELAEAVRVMATAQLNARIGDDTHLRQVPVWSPKEAAFEVVDRLVLTNRDVADIVEFLNALSSDRLAARAGR